VDDLKISHVDKNIVKYIIKILNDKFGKEKQLTNHRVKVLDYLGMTLDYIRTGIETFNMYDYIKKC